MVKSLAPAASAANLRALLVDMLAAAEARAPSPAEECWIVYLPERVAIGWRAFWANGEESERNLFNFDSEYTERSSPEHLAGEERRRLVELLHAGMRLLGARPREQPNRDIIDWRLPVAHASALLRLALGLLEAGDG